MAEELMQAFSPSNEQLCIFCSQCSVVWAIKDLVHFILTLTRLTLHAMPALIRQPLKATHLHRKPVAAFFELTQYMTLMQIPKHSEVGLERIGLTSNHMYMCAAS